MWVYEKRLQFPVNIKEPNAKMAQFIMSQYGGPDGEMGASMRYLSQRYSMPYSEQKAVLTDIGTEELAHLEIVAAIVHQLTRNLTAEELEEQGFGPYYIDHTTGIWPQAAGGVPFNACEFQSKGDPVTDLFEDLAAEQKARSTYDNILRVVTDPDVCEPIPFLKEARDRPLPALRRSPPRSSGEAGLQKLLRFQPKLRSAAGCGRKFTVEE